ncbi:hypothetical protein QE152_g9084 [Popillia japonica]|uniref:Uncharacterized protein n=1 Tax=Popillia japonica TaxID=7064 RepID=A0AAW1LZ40_POPJA
MVQNHTEILKLGLGGYLSTSQVEGEILLSTWDGSEPHRDTEARAWGLFEYQSSRRRNSTFHMGPLRSQPLSSGVRSHQSSSPPAQGIGLS